MNIEEIREYCISKLGVSESFPFNDTALVFKVADKMFALLNLEVEPSINLKGDPEKNIDWRESHSFIKPGYHMNKVHWNTAMLSEDIPAPLLLEMIDHSYDLVFGKLPKKTKETLLENTNN